MKNNTFFRLIISSIFILALIFQLSFAVVGADAKDDDNKAQSSKSSLITETVNLANARQNMSGSGYYWINPEKTLTFRNLNIKTSDDFGIKVPAGATVVLEGENHITAEKYGLACSGEVNFKGTGSLIVESGEYAFYFYGEGAGKNVKILEGTYTLSGEKAGIYSPVSEFSIIGGTINILSNSSESRSIIGSSVNILGGKSELSGGIFASHLVKITGADVKITSEDKAIECDNIISVNNEKISVGSSENNLSEAKNYDGEACVNMTSTYKRERGSIIFGESGKSYMDFVILFAAVVAIAAAILIPTLIKKRRVRKLYEQIDKNNSSVAESKNKKN